ncbi:uncharacterized protein BJX67DRAFT_355911 [Aspergillus lucknowensis]|uniref:Uncharacterized protein n=1 Tax=Aspergillus lucknowensis TaxID=176173 RepID=A0ABR4LPY2_9EURO
MRRLGSSPRRKTTLSWLVCAMIMLILEVRRRSFQICLRGDLEFVSHSMAMITRGLLRVSMLSSPDFIDGGRGAVAGNCMQKNSWRSTVTSLPGTMIVLPKNGIIVEGGKTGNTTADSGIRGFVLEAPGTSGQVLRKLALLSLQ